MLFIKSLTIVCINIFEKYQKLLTNCYLQQTFTKLLNYRKTKTFNHFTLVVNIKNNDLCVLFLK